MIRVGMIDDLELIRSTFTTPHVWDAMSDDGFIKPEEFVPQFRKNTWYLGAWDDSEYLGMFIIYTLNAILCDVHVALLKNCGGIRALKAGRMAFEWCFENTPFRRFTSANPTCNRLGLRYAKLLGFKEFGLNPGAWLKNGKVYDIILLGVSHG